MTVGDGQGLGDGVERPQAVGGLWGAYLAWANARLNNAGRVPPPDVSGPGMAGVDLTAGVVAAEVTPTGGFVDTPPGGSEVAASEDQEWAGYDPDARCPAHGQPRCAHCHRNPSTCAPTGRGETRSHDGCDFYAATGMHWDTCANRVIGPLQDVPAQADEPDVPKRQLRILRSWAGSETFRQAWEVAQRDGAVAGVRAYCDGNADIDQCQAMLSLLDGAQWHTEVLTQALVDVDRLGEYLVDELYESDVKRETSVDIALRLLREAAAKPARIETSMLAAVSGDLAGLADTLKGGARASLAAMALWLAEVIDKRGGEAGPTTSARLAQELRATLVALTTEKSDDVNAVQQFLDMVSTPVRDTADTGAADAGPEGGGDSADDGQAPDAASTLHGRRRPGD